MNLTESMVTVPFSGRLHAVDLFETQRPMTVPTHHDGAKVENQNGRSKGLFANTCPPKNPGTRTKPESETRCISIG